MGILFMGRMNSFSENIYQEGFGLRIGLFGEATVFSFVEFCGGEVSSEYLIDIALWNVSGKILEFSADKK